MNTPLPQTKLFTRILRCLRLVLHFIWGLSKLVCLYPRMNRHQQTEAAKHWSRKFLSILGIELRVSGQVPKSYPKNALLVSNHISWLDIMALACCTLPRFIAKREIRTWPLIGWMVERGGTLFIDRGNRRDASRINQFMAQALKQGDCLCVFPEGTTSPGHDLLPFKSSLFESAVLANSTVLPVAIRYRNERGEPTSAPSYSGAITFKQSFGRILRLRRLIVEVHFGSPLISGQPLLQTRFELSEAAQQQIRDFISLSADNAGTAARIARDPQVEPQ